MSSADASTHTRADLLMQASLHAEQARFRAEAIADIARRAKRLRNHADPYVRQLVASIADAAARHRIEPGSPS